MPSQNQTKPNLTQSQLISDNPFSDVIFEIKSLIPVLESQINALKLHLHQLKDKPKYPQSKQNQTKVTNINSHDSLNNNSSNEHSKSTLQKQIKQISKSIHHKQKHLAKSKLRLQLLNLGTKLGILSSSRIDTLQKIFNHYCHYIFKIGKHVTFQRIQYEKEHLIMERFFAFIHDFYLNKYHHHIKGSIQLIPKHELILLFKKSASNSRNLQFPEFITSLERFALLRYDYQQTFEERREKQEKQRKRIRQINLRRQKQRQRRNKLKRQEQQRQLAEQNKIAVQEENPIKQEDTTNQPNESQEPKEQTKQERKQRKKKQKQKKKKKKQKSQKVQNQNQTANQQNQSEVLKENIQQGENNDQMLQEMMKNDASLSNPNQEFSRLDKFKKAQQKTHNNENKNQQDAIRNRILSLTKEEKFQLLYKLIELDNPKAVESKLRSYQKPLFKQSAQQRKSFILESGSVSKLKQTEYKHGLRLGELKSKLDDRKKEKFKLNVSRSITDQKYQKKRKNDYQNYLNKSILSTNNAEALQMKKILLRKKQEDVPLSLNMLNQSSQRELKDIKLRLDLNRYIRPEEEDSVYLKQYGELGKLRSSNSSCIGKTPRYSVDLKKRANQLQLQEKKKEEEKLQRFALQMFKNQHYMKRFLQRKL